MNHIEVILLSAVLTASSGIPSVLLHRKKNLGQKVSAVFSITGSLVGLAGSIGAFLNGGGELQLDVWNLPAAVFFFKTDALSALFLLPVQILSALGAIYGLEYHPQSENPGSGRRVCVFYGLMTGGMTLLLISWNSVLFLIAWEMMAVSAFFLVSADDRTKEVRSAAWVYFTAAHIGTGALILFFLWLGQMHNGFAWSAFSVGSAAEGIFVFLLLLLGFGMKAGIMPFHVWLPGAHSSAPTHVSAMMSGVMIKMGIYGLLRFFSLVQNPPLWWGAGLAVLGCAGAVLGIIAALAQNDIKRMLAYSSIENMGLIALGTGLFLAGKTFSIPYIMLPAALFVLFHVLNHSIFKSLLFYTAGSAVHSTHTRTMSEMGGLAKMMPLTAAGFMTGVCAASGLPLFNGFAGEFVLYLLSAGLALNSSVFMAVTGILVLTTLTLTGGIASVSFLRAFGVMFLGSPRHPSAKKPGIRMTLPGIAQGALCLGIGLFPYLLLPLLERSVRVLLPVEFPFDQYFPPIAGAFFRFSLLCITIGLPAIVLVFLLTGFLLSRKNRSAADAITWGCGYVDSSSPRLQYSSSSFASTLVSLLHRGSRKSGSYPEIKGILPEKKNWEPVSEEILLNKNLRPFFSAAADRFYRLRIFQQGRVQLYLVYLMLAFLLSIVWSLLRTWGDV